MCCRDHVAMGSLLSLLLLLWLWLWLWHGSTYKSGGVDALFVGCTARVAWLLPFTTIYLGVYEVAKKALLARKLKLGPGE